MAALDDLQQDNASLEHEIGELQKRKADLLKQIEKCRKRKAPSQSLSLLKELLEPKNKKKTVELEKETESQEPLKKKQSKREKRFEEEYIIPEAVKHEFFDVSVSKYFQPLPQVDKAAVDDVGQKSQNVLLENVYRMFGISTLPVKDPSRPSSSELLGVRIEIFNEHELKFEKPYYLFLEQDPKTQKWIIFRHTIPSFVQLETLAHSYHDLPDVELPRFLKHVRNILQTTSRKDYVMERLKSQFKKNISHLQKDPSVTTVKLHLNVDDVHTELTLRCSLEDVESVYIEKGFSDAEKLRIYKLLKGDVFGLPDRFDEVLKRLEL